MEKEGLWILVTFTLGFLVAQIYKLISGLVRNYRTKEVTNFGTAVQYFMRSGGMPSGHATSFTGATIYIGMLYGWCSPIFALSLCMLAIVLYDACHVRYAVGKIGEQLNVLLAADKKKPLQVVEGHTLAQAIVGTLLGIVLGVVVYLLVH